MSTKMLIKQTIIKSSSTIKKVSYDTDNSILIIAFKSGEVYHYKNVPLNVYDEMVNASSAGKYLWANIRGKYMFEKRS